MASIKTIIKGVGHFLPEKVVKNDHIVTIMNTTEVFIEERTGVFSRRHAAQNQALSDLMLPAIEKAVLSAGLKNADIDLLIVNTLSPDFHDPSQACLVQGMLGMGNIPAFDIRAQCSGLLYGMHIAQQFIATQTYQNVLVVCGEMLSKRMDTSDEGRNLSILLGDGVGAVVFSAADSTAGNTGIVDLITKADGTFFQLLWTQSPGTSNRNFAGDDNSCGQFRMNGKPMFEHASASLIAIAQEILNKNNLSLNDIDIIIPHQPNMRILDAVAAGLGVSKEKMALNVHYLGNMASASLPVTLSLAMEEKSIKPGMLALFLGYGSGATWGACLYQF